MVMIVGDDHPIGQSLETICDFLGFGVEHVPTNLDVASLLREHRPMAVIAEVDGAGQDGYHVMIAIADYDRGLPMMLLTGPDPALMGAADAVQEAFQLSSVTLSAATPYVGEVVDFLFRAGRRADCVGVMPV